MKNHHAYRPFFVDVIFLSGLYDLTQPVHLGPDMLSKSVLGRFQEQPIRGLLSSAHKGSGERAWELTFQKKCDLFEKPNHFKK